MRSFEEKRLVYDQLNSKQKDLLRDKLLRLSLVAAPTDPLAGFYGVIWARSDLQQLFQENCA